MKKEPCIRFGIRIRPKISEKPADSRNKSPPSAMLFTAKVNQSDMSDARQHAHPSREGLGSVDLSRLSHKQREKLPSPRRPRVFPGSAIYRLVQVGNIRLGLHRAGWGVAKIRFQSAPHP